jgi:hypothetical protein
MLQDIDDILPQRNLTIQQKNDVNKIAQEC